MRTQAIVFALFVAMPAVALAKGDRKRCMDEQKAAWDAVVSLGDDECQMTRANAENAKRTSACFVEEGLAPVPADRIAAVQSKLNECEQKLARKKAAAEQRRAEEKQEAQEENERKAAEAQRQAEIEAAARSPELQSAVVCFLRDARKAYLAEIATEKHYAKVGGVVDLRALYRLQESVRSADEGLKRLKGRAPKCGATSKAISVCFSEDETPCDQELLSVATAAAPQLENMLPLPTH